MKNLHRESRYYLHCCFCNNHIAYIHIAMTITVMIYCAAPSLKYLPTSVSFVWWGFLWLIFFFAQPCASWCGAGPNCHIWYAGQASAKGSFMLWVYFEFYGGCCHGDELTCCVGGWQEILKSRNSHHHVFLWYLLSEKTFVWSEITVWTFLHFYNSSILQVVWRPLIINTEITQNNNITSTN